MLTYNPIPTEGIVRSAGCARIGHPLIVISYRSPRSIAPPQTGIFVPVLARTHDRPDRLRANRKEPST